MTACFKGSYLEEGKDHQKYLLEWSKVKLISDESSKKMASLAVLGVGGFLEVEMQFVASYPKAMEEDEKLANFIGLTGKDLEENMKTRLAQIFHTNTHELSEEMRELYSDTFYHIVTIREEASDDIQGFVTFMNGRPLIEGEYKITALAVDKSFRRKGLGKLLVSSLEKIGISPKKIILHTRPSNKVAIEAYKKWGFIEDIKSTQNSAPYFIEGHWIHLVRKS